MRLPVPVHAPTLRTVGARIFISYRREDSQADAGRLSADLVREFGSDRVFTDIDSIPIGGSVQQRISDAIDSAAVVLVLIGPDWSLERLSNPHDWVRIEIASAIEKHVPIIPVRLRRAEMPEASQLPEELAALVDYNGAEIEHSSWRRDLPPIIDAIRLELNNANPGCPDGEPAAETGERRRQVSGRMVLIAGVAVSTSLLAVLAVIAFSSSKKESPAASDATSSGATIATQATSSPSATPSRGEASSSTIDVAVTTSPPGAPSTDLIPITLDSPLVKVLPPAVLTDEGYVLFPQAEVGEVEVQFTANTSGGYFVWARVRISADVAELVDSNSLYVVEGANLPRSDEFVWDFWENLVFPEAGAWEWDRISRRGATGTSSEHVENPFVVAGRQGAATVFTLGGREPGVALERIYVTNDLTWRPPECEASIVCSSRRTDPAAETND